MEPLRLLCIGASALVAGVAAWFAWHSKRRLDDRVQQFREELDEQGGGPIDPYAALADLHRRRQDRPGGHDNGGR